MIKKLSRDPIAEQGGLDTGEYANDDPIDSTDANGLDPKPGWKQIWDTSKLLVTNPQLAVSTVRSGLQLMEQAAIQKAVDIVGCQTDPVKKIVYDQGVNAGLIKAGVNTVTGIAEMQDTADDAINWLLTGSPGVYRDSPIPKHFISNVANSAIDSKFAGIAQVDPKAFKTGEFVGNAEFQVGMIGLSLVDPLAGLSEVGEAALAADAFEQALSGARAAEVASSVITADAADPVLAAATRVQAGSSLIAADATDPVLASASQLAEGDEAFARELVYRTMSEKEFASVQANRGLVIRPRGSSELGITLNPDYGADWMARNPKMYAVRVQFEVQPGTFDELISQGATHSSARSLFPDLPAYKSGMPVPQIKLESGNVLSILLGNSPDSVEYFNANILSITAH